MVLAQGEQKRRKGNKNNWTNRFCTLVVARLSSSYKWSTIPPNLETEELTKVVTVSLTKFPDRWGQMFGAVCRSPKIDSWQVCLSWCPKSKNSKHFVSCWEHSLEISHEFSEILLRVEDVPYICNLRIKAQGGC